MNLVFFGPPGAGKGTAASEACEIFKIPHISTGDVFREEIRKESKLGKEVKDILATGALVPDETTIRIVAERLSQPDTQPGFILDGFPRTLSQARALSEQVEVEHVLNFLCPEEILIKRLAGRRQCPKCRTIYNVSTLGKSKQCPKDQTTLSIREDDKIESVRNRLKVYAQTSKPVLDWYRERNKLHDLNGNQNSGGVLKSLRDLIFSFKADSAAST